MSYFLVITGIIILLLLLIFFAPFTISFCYLEEIKLSISFLIFKMKLLPENEKKEKKEKVKKEKKKKAKAKEDKEEEKKEKRPLKENLSLAIKILKDLKSPFMRFLKKIRISDLKLEISVSSEDAEKTTKNFALIHEGTLAILNLLDKIFTVSAKSICIYPEYREEKTKFYIEGKVKLNLMQAVIFIASAFKRSSKDVMKLIK